MVDRHPYRYSNPGIRTSAGTDGHRPIRGRIAVNAEELLREISDYCRATRIAESTFGRRAVNDGKLVSRLRFGGRITIETANRIREFISTHPPGSNGSSVIIDRKQATAMAPVPAQNADGLAAKP